MPTSIPSRLVCSGLGAVLCLGASIAIAPRMFAVAPARSAQPAQLARVDRALCALFPARTAVYVESAQLSGWLRGGAAHPLWQAVRSAAFGPALDAALRAKLAELEPRLVEFLGPDWSSAAAKLCDAGAALGIASTGAKPAFALALRSTDAGALTAYRERALAAIGRRFGAEKLLEKPHARVHGADVWRLGDELSVAQRGELLIVGNDRAYVDEMLVLADEPKPLGLLEQLTLVEALAQRTSDTALLAWMDVQRASELKPPAERGDGLAKLRASARDPRAVMLLGPALGMCGSAEHVTLELCLRGEDPSLRATIDGTHVPDELLRSASGAVHAMPSRSKDASTRDVLDATLHRDLAAVLAARARLFDAEHLPDLAKGTSDLALLFMGKDLVDDVLPRVSPWWSLVARPIDFGALPHPSIELPALAGVFELAHPDVDGPLFVSAFQSTVTLTSVDRAQKGMDALVLALGLEGQTQIQAAHFVPPAAGEAVDMRYNLAPACAQVGTHFVLGTHESLVRELVRELRDGDAAARVAERANGAADARAEALGSDAETARGSDARTLDVVHLHGPAAARYVVANRDALVLNAVLEEGKSEQQARDENAGFAALLELIPHATWIVRRDGERTEVQLDLDVRAATPTPDRTSADGASNVGTSASGSTSADASLRARGGGAR